jgi:hypothetical protein
LRHVIAKFHMNTKNIKILLFYHKDNRPEFMKSESAPETLVKVILNKKSGAPLIQKTNQTKSPKEFLDIQNTFFISQK